MSMKDFNEHVSISDNILAKMPNKINFYAFTYGHYNKGQLSVLKNLNGLVPVLMDGVTNYENNDIIHRVCIDGIKF